MNNSRRSFLKVGAAASAALVGSGTATGAFAKEFAARTKKIPSASHFGAFYAHAREGKIVDITSQHDSDANPTVIDRKSTRLNSSH